MPDPAVELVVQRCQALLGSLTDSQQRQAVNALALARGRRRGTANPPGPAPTGGAANDSAPFGGDAGCRGAASDPVRYPHEHYVGGPGIQL